MQVRFVSPARASDTESGRYSLVVRATDSGRPPLFSDVEVEVRVGSVSNLRPRFLQDSYEARVPEDARPGMEVARVKADDADGPNEAIR